LEHLSTVNIIKVSLNGYKEDALTRDEAVIKVLNAIERNCVNCSIKQDLKVALQTLELYVDEVAGAEITE
jgi:hypothetical protein